MRFRPAGCVVAVLWIGLVACRPSPPPAPGSPVHTLEITRQPGGAAASATRDVRAAGDDADVAATGTAIWMSTLYARMTANARDTTLTARAPTATATPTPQLATLRPTLSALRQPEEVWTVPSPDGAWIAEGVNQFAQLGRYSCYHYERVAIRRDTGGAEWVVLEGYGECGLGYTFFEPIGWSADSAAFSYWARVIPDGCPTYVGGDVHRLDPDGRTGEALQHASAWAFSPDRRRLALASGRELTLWSGAGEVIARVSVQVPETIAAGVLWSPEGHALLVNFLAEYCGLEGGTSVIRLEWPGLAQTPLLLSDPRVFVPVAWEQEDRVELRGPGGKTWWLDPQTGEVSP